MECGGKILIKQVKWTKELVALILLGLGQIGYGLYASVQIADGTLSINMNNMIILLLFVSNLLIIYGFYIKKQRKQLESKLRETQYLLQIEQMNYQIIEERRVQVAKIRHDLNNQLATIQQLLLQEQQDYATKLLEGMESSIQQSTGRIYCNNSLVNIILNDKQRTFFDESISFLSDISLPEETFVNAQQLCSVFSNVLQLAIQYLQGNVNTKKQVVLLTTTTSEMIQVVCEVSGIVSHNSFQEIRYEEKVLQEIAAQYSGKLQINNAEEKITIELTLQRNS